MSCRLCREVPCILHIASTRRLIWLLCHACQSLLLLKTDHRSQQNSMERPKTHNMALLVASKTCLAFMSDTCWRVRMHGDRAKFGSPDEARAFHPETCLPLQLAEQP